MSDADRRRWDERFAERGRHSAEDALGRPADFVERIVPRLPPGRALDVAGGGGRNAVALARAGLRVTVADVSPVGLSLARERASAAGVCVATVEIDFDESEPPAGPWEVIFVHHFFDRSLYTRLPGLLAPGGVLAICHPTRKNLERHPRPSARFLLEEGELAELLSGLELISYDESWSAEGRHEARALARR